MPISSLLRTLLLALVLALGGTWPAVTAAATIDVEDATIADLQKAMAAGALTSEKLTQIYLGRIAAYDKQGPAINTVITLNPHALEIARELDAERRAGHIRGPLHGIPVVLKDNFDTADLPTTGGCQLLAGSLPVTDSFAVNRLRRAGAIILAKMNLSELPGSEAGASRKDAVPPGFSTAGGQTLNPHDPTRSPAGSSSGTGAGIAAAFAQFGLGTDSGGSVRSPAAANGIVALKPTYGLIGRSGIMPSALSFDAVGPMARNVYDVAVALDVLAGVDPADGSTERNRGHVEAEYTRFLTATSLRGARIGVARPFIGENEDVDHVVESAIATLKKQGAIIVDPVDYPDYLIQSRQSLQHLVSEAEFKTQIGDYLKTRKPAVPGSLQQLIAMAKDPANGYRSAAKIRDLEWLDEHALSLDDPRYLAAKNEGLASTRAAIDALFIKYQLDAIVYPTSPQPASLLKPAAAGLWRARLDRCLKDWSRCLDNQGYGKAPAARDAAGSALSIANQTGYPDLTVPAGTTPDQLPVSISFFGTAWSEPRLLGYGYAFEQATKARVDPKFTPTLSQDRFSD